MIDSKGFHHFYLGIITIVIGQIFVLIGFSMLISDKYEIWACNVFAITGYILCVVGLVEEIDDWRQHKIQKTNPDYRSPLHRLYAKTLWRIKWVQSINAFMDRIF
jgi:hypothetical protein